MKNSWRSFICSMGITCCATMMLTLSSDAIAMEYQLNSSLGAGLEIILLYEGHESNIPKEFRDQPQLIPAGSFLLQNGTTKAVTALVVTWRYTDSAGAARVHTLNCDGYLTEPVDRIVKPLKTTLITPQGCIGDDYFTSLMNATSR